MIRTAVLSIVLLLTSLQIISAQDTGLRVSKINFSLGNDFDRINGLNYEYFTKQIPGSESSKFQGFDFEDRDMEGGVCENPHYRLGLSLEHSKFKNFELQTNMVYMPNRVDAVSYNNNYFDWNDAQYLNFYSTQNELALEASLLYKVPVLKAFHLYGGIGTNVGFTFGNTLCIDASPGLIIDEITPRNVNEILDDVQNNQNPYMECFEPNSTFNQRLFAQVGFGATLFKRVELSLMIRRGVGYRAQADNSVQATHLISSSIGASYLF